MRVASRAHNLKHSLPHTQVGGGCDEVSDQVANLVGRTVQSVVHTAVMQTSVGGPVIIGGSSGATGVFSRFRLVGAGMTTNEVAVDVAVIVGDGVAVNVGVAVFVGVEDGSIVSVDVGETTAVAV